MAETFPFPPVTLIIPNFNGADLLRKNLPAVLEATRRYPGRSAVIVVDDASQDSSVEVIRQEFPAVCLVRHEVNRGFAEAIHSGVDAADTELLVLLNSDVRPASDFIAPLTVHFQQADVFSVSPLVLDAEGRVGDESWRCYRLRGGRFRALRRPGWVPRKAVATLFNSGGSMMVRKSLLLELGGFSDIFKPYYSEDSDLGIRAWRRGWQNLMEPNSRVIHDHSASSISSNVARARVRKVRRRNQFLLEWIHLPARDLLLALVPGYLTQAAGRLLRADTVYFSGLLAALARLPEVHRLRAEVERTAVRGLWDVMAFIERSAADDAS